MINCEVISNAYKKFVKDRISGKSIGLVIIQVGDNPASNNYVRGKLKDCAEVGIHAQLIKYEDTVDEDVIISKIEDLNEDKNVHGIIVQLPLPEGFNEKRITQAVSIKKDVDGFKSESSFIPCTPKGVLMLTDFYDKDFFMEKKITLVGYGKLVNRPLMNLISDRGATVTVCRSHTRLMDLKEYCNIADVIITAVGKHGTIKKDYVPYAGQWVIDCGIDVIDGKQYGDCDVSIYDNRPWVTPRVKGMGLMTRAALLMNVAEAAGIDTTGFEVK